MLPVLEILHSLGSSNSSIVLRGNDKFIQMYKRPFLSYKYGLLTKREVKITGYWPNSFFACLDQDGVVVHKHTERKEANIQLS